MMNNLPNPICTNFTGAPLDPDDAVFACSRCGAIDGWIDMPDSTWLCTAPGCNTSHIDPLADLD